MLNVFVAQPQGLERVDVGDGALPSDGHLARPARTHDRGREAVEATLGVDVPTREEMKEIEASNRLYEDNGALYMTATVAAQARHRPPRQHCRHVHPGGQKARHQSLPRHQAVSAVHRLREQPPRRMPECVVDPRRHHRGLHRTHCRHPRACRQRSRRYLGQHLCAQRLGTPTSRDLRSMIERIGFNGELNSKARESLVSLGRLLMFVQQSGNVDMSRERARSFSLHQPRRHLALGPLEFPRREGVVPPRSDARSHQRRTEQHHQDLLRRRGHVHAAHAHREHLRHELSSACRICRARTATSSSRSC